MRITNGAKSSIAYTFSSFISKSISILSIMFFTKYLTTAEIGTASIFLTWQQIIAIICNLSLSGSAFNVGLAEFSKERDKFTFSMLVLSTLSTFAFFIIYLILHTCSADFGNIPFTLMIIMFIGFIFNPALDFWLARQRYEYKYKMSALVAILSSVISVGVSIIMVIIFKNHSIVMNYGYLKVGTSAIIIIVFGLFFYLFYAYKSSWKICLKYWKFILPICLPLIIHGLSKYILDASDKLMIGYFYSDAEVGIYSTLYTISSTALILWTAINGSLIPFMYENLKNNNGINKIKKIVTPVIFFFGVFTIAFCLVAPEVLKILTTDEFFDANKILPPVISSIFLTSIYGIYGNVISYMKKTYYIMIATLSSAILNVILNYFLIPSIGYEVASYTTLISFVFLAFLMYLFSKLSLNKNICNPFFVLIYSLFVLTICLLSYFLYDYIQIRYSIIFIFVLFSVVFRKRIINLFKHKGESK